MKNNSTFFKVAKPLWPLKILLILFLGFPGSYAFGQSPYIDNTPGGVTSFTVPAGVTSITVEIWGGGGAGGGSTTNNSGGSGGGSGGYSTRTFTVTPNSTITYTTGTGGTGGTGAKGGDGTASTIIIGATSLTANGGIGGRRNQGAFGTGGNASGGTDNTTGNPGAVGTTTGNKGGNAPAGGGAGGAGGRTNNDGNPGIAPGGGGGGGEASSIWGYVVDRNGGNGGNGGIKITYTCPTFSAGTNQTLAACTTIATLNAPALSLPATGLWTKVSGSGNITTPGSRNSDVTGIVPGTPLILRWTVTNGNCGSSYSDVTITSPAGPACLPYCIPTGIAPAYPISNVQFGGINNNSTATTFYENFSSIIGNVVSGQTYPITVTAKGAAGNTFGVYVYFDWNNNADFSDDGGPYTIGTYTTATATLASSITIPLTAYTATPIRFRVINQFNVIPPPCPTGGSLQVEDYSLNISVPPVCAPPTTVPTALNLTAGTPNGTTINGSFTTATTPAPNSYLVVVSTSNIAPTLVNGTTYTIGSNVGAGYTVVDTDSNTTFVAGGLNINTIYYFYIYSMNNLCSGGPLYYNNPLTGSLKTGTTIPTFPTTGCPATTANDRTRLYIDDVSFLGMYNGNINNVQTIPSAYGTTGYQDYTTRTKAQQIQGEGVNVSFHSGGTRGTWKAWVDWNKDGDFADAGELVYDSKGVAMTANTFGFIIPAGASPGDYRIRIRVYNGFGIYRGGIRCNSNVTYENYGDFANHFNSCTPFTSYNFAINDGNCGSQNVTWNEYGEAEDYLFTVIESCDAKITKVTDGERCDSGTVNLGATGSSGVRYYWYAAETGGTALANTATGSWTTPSINTTTSYWVTAFNGCESKVRRKVIAKVNPLPTITFTPNVAEVCGEDIQVNITAGGDKQLKYLIDEDFESGALGVFSNNFLTTTAYNAQTAWQNKTSTLIPTGSSWYPAISSNFGANHFALVTSDIGANGIIVNNALVSPVVDTTEFLDLTLTFRMYYSRYFSNSTNPTKEYMQMEVSTDGGSNWSIIPTVPFPPVPSNVITDAGIGTMFQDFYYNMNNYVDKPLLKVRIRYFADDWYDGAAVDDIKLYGNRPLVANFKWTGPANSVFDVDCDSAVPAGGSESVCIKPLPADLENNSSWTINAKADLGNGCNATGIITIQNNNKVWPASATSTQWNSGDWKPDGLVPEPDKCVIIKKNVILGTGVAGGFAKNITVKAGGTLTIDPGKSLFVKEEIVNETDAANFVVASDANLLQENDLAINTGPITVKRNSQLKRLDYTYWSSPVTGQNLKTFSPGTLNNRFYTYNESNDLFDVIDPVANSFDANGKGYAIRANNTYGTTLQTFPGSFVGVPNNGVKSITLNYTDATHGYNLVGNPYSSNLNFYDLYANNSSVINNTAYFWTNINPNPPMQGSGYPQSGWFNNYAVLNGTGGVGATGTAQNGTVTPNEYIKVGQGFIVKAKQAGSLNFKNAIRTDNSTSIFFNKNGEEVDRYWLNLTTPLDVVTMQLIGYKQEATNGFELDYDAPLMVLGSDAFYSILDGQRLAIQGKAPFVNTDIVPLGSSHYETGNYTISLGNKEGIFANGQNIYLKDNQTSTVTNLSEGNYTFNANQGLTDGRFQIIYQPEVVLGTGVSLQENLIVYRDGNDFVVKSSAKNIIGLEVYDVSGRLIIKLNPNHKEVRIDATGFINGVYVLKVNREGNIVTKKVIK